MKIFYELPMITLKNKLIPKLILGSSPFIGAGQFGEKALIYFNQFAKHPKNVVKLLVKSVEFGVPAIQIFPESWLINCVREAEDITGKKIYTVLNIGYRFDDFEKYLKESSSLNLQAVLIHARITDTLDKKLILGCVRKIKELNTLRGFVTHTPAKTLPKLIEIDQDFDIIMAPVNNISYMTTSEGLEAIKNLKENLNPIIIGKKVLAAGKLKPSEAIKFAYNYVDSIVIGITSEKEMIEDYMVAKKLIEQK